MSQSNPLNIALLKFSGSYHSWECLLIDQILKDPRLHLNLIINCNPNTQLSSYDFRNKYLYRHLINFDRKKFKIKKSPLDYEEPQRLDDIKNLSLNILIDKKQQQVDFDKIKEIKEYRPAIILAFGKGPIMSQIAECATFGIWTHEITPEGTVPCYDIGFEGMVNKKPIVKTGLFAFTSQNQIYQLYNSSSSTEGISMHRLFDRIYWKMPSFFSRIINAYFRLGEANFKRHYFSESIKQLLESPSKSAKISLLNASRMYFQHYLTGKIRNKMIKQKWIMLYNLAENGHQIDRLDFKKYTKIIPPKGEFWADPFVLKKDDKYFVYFEACNVKSRSKGNISLITITESGRVSEASVILVKPYHLSYPFLFEWNNNWYMIPETAQNKTIELYKCIQFPDQWEFQYNIMEDVNAVDTTLVFHNNRWWLFVNMKAHGSASSWDELFLFYADNPLSKNWEPHPLNPVVSDVTRSRPAGSLIKQQGKLYRPSQNSANYYGYGLKYNEIVVLNESEYEEQEVKSFIPNWDPTIKAIHSINQLDKFSIIDAIWEDKRHY